ncbi:MAG: ABC transporter permease [Clostridiales bacterium]|nr:ABC transporter permease [Clostridiales bacterium]
MRKSSLYPRLAVLSIKNNGKFYYPYILTCIFTIAMYYIMVFIQTNEGIRDMPGSDSLKSFMEFGSVIIGIFATIFLFYTNSFLMRRRKKELGLYNILGMEKRHIARVLFWETVITGIGSIALGLSCGILLSKLVLMLLLNLLQFSVPFGFSVSQKGVSSSIFLFSAVFVLILLSNLLKIKLSKPIELLKGGEMGQREPKTKVLLTIIGILSLGAGYAIAILTKSPLQAIFLFFIAVLLVIVGTYLLFTTGSIAMLKLLRKNKKYYYKTKHFTAVSGLIYRMKQNAMGLASICILSTMVLVTISTTVALYAGFEDIIGHMFPSDILINVYNPAPGEVQGKYEKIMDEVSRNGLEASDIKVYTSLSFAAKRDGNRFAAYDNNYVSDGVSELFFITSREYEALTGRPADLSPGEILVYSRQEMQEEYLEILDMRYKVKGYLENFDIYEQRTIASVVDTHYIVLRDEAELNGIYQKHQKQAEAFEYKRSPMIGNIAFDLDGNKQEVIACYRDISAAASEPYEYTYTDENGSAKKAESSSSFSVSCRQLSSDEIYNTYGGFLFLGIFLGSLFLVAAILIIYYKQITEGYSDRERFAIMQKVGMSRAEVKSTIGSQVITVFFLPLAVSCIHIAFAFSIMTKILRVFGLVNVVLFALCTAGTIAVFAVIYAAVYAVTARVYYKIVS